MSVPSGILKLPQRKTLLCLGLSRLRLVLLVQTFTVFHGRTVLVSRVNRVCQADEVSRTRFVWQAGEFMSLDSMLYMNPLPLMMNSSWLLTSRLSSSIPVLSIEFLQGEMLGCMGDGQ